MQFNERYGGGSVMVWGGITMTDITPLHIVQGRVTGQYFQDNILTPFVVLYARHVGQCLVFQDDNIHTHYA